MRSPFRTRLQAVISGLLTFGVVFTAGPLAGSAPPAASGSQSASQSASRSATQSAAQPAAPGAAPSLPAALSRLAGQVSEERIAASIRRLESFRTRQTFSGGPDWRDPDHGIDAARLWIAQAFHEASPRLHVYFERQDLPVSLPRLFRPGALRNVVAFLPAATEEGRKRQFIVSGHYDSIAADADGTIHWDRPDLPAPGANDDASGTAVVLEAARVLAAGTYDADIVFIAFAGEEQGLYGSIGRAGRAKAAAQQGGPRVLGVLNNDIVGGIVGGDGRTDDRSVRLFSEGPEDSASRELARLSAEIARTVVPGFGVDLILRADRFGRGGDHLPFNREDIPGVRFTSAVEDYSRQHSVRDTFDGCSPSYAARVARVNVATLADLASAPPAPIVLDEKGNPTLDRGPTGYDARLRWKPVGPVADLAGYLVLRRETTSSLWQDSYWAGPVEAFTLPGVSIDRYVFGVRAVDREGHVSTAATYQLPPRKPTASDPLLADPSDMPPEWLEPEGSPDLEAYPPPPTSPPLAPNSTPGPAGATPRPGQNSAPGKNLRNGRASGQRGAP